MINIGGYQKSSTVSSFGREKGISPKNENEKKKLSPDKKNTDRADFSSYSGIGKKHGLKVGSSTDKTDGLSENAKKYLEKLKSKYGNMDFIIADYSTDEEADKLLSRGKGEYNVLITPDLLEKMAAEGSAATEYEGLIESSVAGIENIKKELGEDADMVGSFGVAIGSDGTATFTAKLIEGLTSKDGTGTVKANTVDDMLAQLKEAKDSQAEKLAKLREERASQNKDTTTADTEDADREVRKLKDSRQKLMSQIRAEQNDDKKSELEDKLRQLDSELSRKDNDSYRKQHSHFSAKA